VTQRHPDTGDEVDTDYSINEACQSQPRRSAPATSTGVLPRRNATA
jgi:hypothetical protein